MMLSFRMQFFQRHYLRRLAIWLAVIVPALLLAHGIPPVARDDFAIRAFPGDVYALSPATWSDVDENVQEPGIIWGAWKAKTMLDRRRGPAQDSAQDSPPD